MVKCRRDPLRFVLFAFPWGEEGTELEDYEGPEEWQEELLGAISLGLLTPDEAIQIAAVSGHGVGKSALASWLILWAISTAVDTKGVVTANTETQLKTKTWAELAFWHRNCATKHWFKYTPTKIHSLDPAHKDTWRIDMVPWSLTNTEAFAGLHNKGKRILLLFDEASAIPDKIWEVARGALTDKDTEIIWCAFGNGTRNAGEFRECFRRHRHRWTRFQVDSRNVSIANQKQLQQWLEDWGENSDFFRVRVRGLFPSASELQLIPSDLVFNAMHHEERCNLDDPVVMSLDVARGGSDKCVFRWRKGLNGRWKKKVTLEGSITRDSMRLVDKAVALLDETKPDAFFIDATGIGGPVGDRIRQLGYLCQDVQFGSKARDKKMANKRTEMYFDLLDAFRRGFTVHDDADTEMELTAVEYTHDRTDRTALVPKDVMKKELGFSPDDADALAMLYAFPVALKPKQMDRARPNSRQEYNPFKQKLGAR